MQARVQLLGDFGVTNWANVFYMEYTTPNPTATALNGWATSIGSAWNLYLKGLVHTTCRLTNVIVTDISSRTGNSGSGPGAVSGTKAGTQLPANVAFCATKVIARRYRGGHPRIYLPGMCVADALDQRNWTGTLVSTNQGALNSWLASLNAAAPAGLGAVHMTNVSYWFTPTAHLPPVLRPTPVIDPVVSFRADSRIDSQRRRLD
jgi:hypothetical protein